MPDVEAFVASIPDERRRADAQALCALMHEITGEPPAMWGGSIVGFGSYHYRYESEFVERSVRARRGADRPT